MESFEKLLSAGGHTNSLGRSGEVLTIVTADTSRMQELYDCIFARDAWVRMRAIDTFEKLIRETPELAQPYLDAMLADLTLSTQPSVQWHLAQIVVETILTNQQRDIAISWLKHCIATTAVDWIVAVNVMKALLYFHKHMHVDTSEIAALFEVQLQHSSKSVRKKATLFLQELWRPGQDSNLRP